MCTLKPHKLSTTREKHQLMLVSSPGENVPLKQNWSERYCALPIRFEKIINDIYELEVQSDDVFIVTFPKCGTTWAQEAAWLIYNDLNFQSARDSPMNRVPYIELSGVQPYLPYNSVEQCKLVKPPRLLKSHLPAHLIPHQIWDKKQKIIYVARNPKDTAISYYHFYIGLGMFTGTLDEYVDDFVNDNVTYASFWDHILDFWKMRNEPNILFITYEDMKRDLPSVLQEMAAFLEKPKLDDEQIEKLQEHLSFKNMKDNLNPTEHIRKLPKVQPTFNFMRRGITGAYKDEMSPESQKKIDEWTAKCLKGQNVTVKEIFGDI